MLISLHMSDISSNFVMPKARDWCPCEGKKEGRCADRPKSNLTLIYTIPACVIASAT